MYLCTHCCYLSYPLGHWGGHGVYHYYTNTRVCPVHVYHWDTVTDMGCTDVLIYTRITAVLSMCITGTDIRVYLCTNIRTHSLCPCVPLGHLEGHGVYQLGASVSEPHISLVRLTMCPCVRLS